MNEEIQIALTGAISLVLFLIIAFCINAKSTIKAAGIMFGILFFVVAVHIIVVWFASKKK